MLRRIKQTGEDERVAFETIGEKLRQARHVVADNLMEVELLEELSQRYSKKVDVMY